MQTQSDEMTEMNRAQVVIGCRSITHPGGFPYGKFLAEHTLLFVYAMCYSCLAPLILPAGFSKWGRRRIWGGKRARRANDRGG